MLQKKLESSLSESFLNGMEKKYGEKLQQNVLLDALEERCLETIQRLRLEISALSRRGNLNLVIGVITTIIAVIILGVAILSYTTPVDLKELSVYLLPRITLSIFIEIFSFFFLRLYSSSLKDIKYYQNELTNIESKFIALRGAFSLKNKPAFEEILKNLVMTERNFVLKKGETTTAIEKTKLDYDAIKETVDNFVEILNGKKQNIADVSTRK